jgi:hypothetical protein
MTGRSVTAPPELCVRSPAAERGEVTNQEFLAMLERLRMVLIEDDLRMAEMHNGKLEGWGQADELDTVRIRKVIEDIGELTGMRAWKSRGTRMVPVELHKFVVPKDAQDVYLCFSIENPTSGDTYPPASTACSKREAPSTPWLPTST